MKNFNVKHSAFHAIEDGTSETKPIAVLFDVERMVFSTPLPKYVHQHLANFVTPTIDANAINASGVIESEQCRTVIEIYERACEAYCNWRLAMGGPTRLWVGGMADPSDFMTQVFGVNTMAALGYTPVKVTKKGDSVTMVEVTADGDFGRLVGAAGVTGDLVFVDDTPEMRAKLDRLIKSVGVAGSVIKGIALAADPAKYIMEIAEESPAIKSEPAGVPLTPDAPATTPVPVVNPDDDF